MSRLKELSEYKNTVLQRLVGNQNILKGVHYQEENFLDMPNVDFNNVVFNNIYPFDFIPTTAEELSTKKTYLTISISDYRKGGKGNTFKAGNLYIHVFTHKDLHRTAYGFLRTDYLISEVDELLNSERGIGIGELEFVGMKESKIVGDYLGYLIHYRPVGWN